MYLQLFGSMEAGAAMPLAEQEAWGSFLSYSKQGVSSLIEHWVGPAVLFLPPLLSSSQLDILELTEMKSIWVALPLCHWAT